MLGCCHGSTPLSNLQGPRAQEQSGSFSPQHLTAAVPAEPLQLHVLMGWQNPALLPALQSSKEKRKRPASAKKLAVQSEPPRSTRKSCCMLAVPLLACGLRADGGRLLHSKGSPVVDHLPRKPGRNTEVRWDAPQSSVPSWLLHLFLSAYQPANLRVQSCCPPAEENSVSWTAYKRAHSSWVRYAGKGLDTTEDDYFYLTI